MAERLDQLAPGSLWNEPIDIICGGPEFFAQAKDYIIETMSKLASLPSGDALKEAIQNMALALSCHFGVSVQSGNHQLIVESLDLNLELTKKVPEDT